MNGFGVMMAATLVALGFVVGPMGAAEEGHYGVFTEDGSVGRPVYVIMDETMIEDLPAHVGVGAMMGAEGGIKEESTFPGDGPGVYMCIYENDVQAGCSSICGQGSVSLGDGLTQYSGAKLWVYQMSASVNNPAMPQPCPSPGGSGVAYINTF